MYEASLVFICSANKAQFQKHIVPSQCNHTMSRNLSMVNEALRQGTVPSFKMCSEQSGMEGRRGGSSKSISHWDSQPSSLQAFTFLLLFCIAFLLVAAIEGTCAFWCCCYWKRQQNHQPLSHVF